MTRRYIVEIAQRLRALKPTHIEDYISMLTWRLCCVAVADAIAQHNKAFDRERFLQDCGVSQ